MNDETNNIIEKLKSSTVFKVISGYAIVAFITVQIASLVSSSFGFGQEFMQNIIIVFLVILPFIALIAWAASSKYGTFKILGISFFLLFTGYGTGSYVWVNKFMLPNLQIQLEEDNYVGAWAISNKINSFAPFFSKLDNEDNLISSIVNIKVQQEGVSVYWRPYGESNADWRYLGSSPLEPSRLPNGVLQVKFEKDNFETKIITSSNPSLRFYNFSIDFGWLPEPINLQAKGSVPDGMIYIEGGNFIPAITGNGVDPVFLNPFYIDKYEVTNKDFKKFVDAGGYENKQYWVDMEFINDGKSLSWEEVKDLLKDSTGMMGPAKWEVGTYLEGSENLPVTGISWYEAMAYARYKGNILPPMFHWAKAAFSPDEAVSPISPRLLKNSNFSQKNLLERNL